VLFKITITPEDYRAVIQYGTKLALSAHLLVHLLLCP